MNFQEFKNKSQAGKEAKIASGGLMYAWQRNLSVIISFLLIKLFPRISPNSVSISNILLLFIIFALSFWANNDNALLIVIIQLLLINFTSVMDKIDGEIARYKEYYTQQGVYYDLTYHFFYPFVFYFVLGYYFYVHTNNLIIVLLAMALAIIATNQRMLGKLRHHVKYKVVLEAHQNIIKDVNTAKKQHQKKPLLWRIVYYSIFLLYDWVWSWYLLIAIISYFNFYLAMYIYFIHLALSLFLFLKQILIDFPRKRLFSKEEF